MNDRFLRACRRQPVDATPVWFMRQAGRYMADYRALRERYSLLEICRHPELAVAVTLQPVEVIDVDAAILFSDLLLPFTPMGLDVRFRQGRRTVDRATRSVGRRRRSAAHVRSARGARPRARDDPSAARGAADRVPLIGFGGAPFTLAAYAIEGGPSTNYARTKAFMYAQPARVASALRTLRRA